MRAVGLFLHPPDAGGQRGEPRAELVRAGRGCGQIARGLLHAGTAALELREGAAQAQNLRVHGVEPLALHLEAREPRLDLFAQVAQSSLQPRAVPRDGLLAGLERDQLALHPLHQLLHAHDPPLRLLDHLGVPR